MCAYLCSYVTGRSVLGLALGLVLALYQAFGVEGFEKLQLLVSAFQLALEALPRLCKHNLLQLSLFFFEGGRGGEHPLGGLFLAPTLEINPAT